MPERLHDDPTLPPPGRRSGAGSASILPYLIKSLATKPQAPTLSVPAQAAAKSAPAAGDKPDAR